MGAAITGKEYKLGKIFSSEFDYVIPDYQRPYAWTEEEAGILFDDLYDFYTTEPSDNNYFLGSIVLIKKRRPIIASSRWSAKTYNTNYSYVLFGFCWWGDS